MKPKSITVGTLPEKLDFVFEVLTDLQERLKQSNGRRLLERSESSESKEVLDSICRLIDAVASNSRSYDQDTWSMLARALLAAEKGSRFDACILQAIRDYGTAYDNVRRYRHAEVPEPFKSDVVARFRQQLDIEAQRLAMLQASPFEPSHGDPIDFKRHRVVKVQKCIDATHSECVAEVRLPGFEWLNDQGVQRIQPAEIVAYDKFDVPAPDRTGSLLPMEGVSRRSDAMPNRDGKSVASKRVKPR